METQVKKIISSGQRGVDIAALRVAKKLMMQTGGVCSWNRRTQDIASTYGLSFIMDMQSYFATVVKRSQMNVNQSDATIVFRLRESPSADRIIHYAMTRKWPRFYEWHSNPYADYSEVATGYKPVLIVTRLTKLSQMAISEFLVRHEVRTLNVTGNQPWTGRPNLEQEVEAFLFLALLH